VGEEYVSMPSSQVVALFQMLLDRNAQEGTA
jgi:hypothetical protein